MTAIEIRDMRIGDASRVAEIERKCIDTPWSERSITSLVNSNSAVARVACIGDTIVGYYSFYYVEDVADINNIAVCEDYRRQGIGGSLIGDMTEQCARRGVSAINLEVRDGNMPAIGLYEKHGFVKCGVRKKYYDNTSDAILYTKSM